MRCLILGAGGQIGSNLVNVCMARETAHLGTWYRRPHHDFVPLDVRDREAVVDLIDDYQPEVTFLAAGVASAGYAEQFADEVRSITTEGTRIVAEAVAAHGGTLATFSPDTIFGDCSKARREEDATAANLGIHAAAAVEAEAIVRTTLPDRHLIVRTGWVYGPTNRHGFFSSTLRALENDESVEVATDRFGQPTFAPDLAIAVFDLATTGKSGTFHVVGPDRHTEATWARLLCHVFGHDVDRLRELPAAELADGEPRPNRVWLDRFKARSILGAKMVRSTADGLRACRSVVPALADHPVVRAA